MRVAIVAIALLFGCAKASTAAQSDGAPGDGAAGGSDSAGGPRDAAKMDAAIDADLCPTLPCSLAPQCGCTGATPACDLGSGNTTACRAAGTGTETTTCQADTTCSTGYVCVGDGTNNSCEKYCASGADCTGPRGQCVDQLVDSSSMPIPGAVVCSSNCDPSQVTNATCPSGWTCDLFTSTYMTTTYNIVDCRKAGTATQGQTCSTTVACAAGYTCVNTGTSMVCAKICTPPSNTGCPGVTTCGSFQTPFKVPNTTGTEYGACL
jgi:hypothetical protein